MRKRVWKMAFPVATSLVILAGCGSASGDNPGQTGAQNLAIEAQSIAFSTDQLVVKAGQPVKLSLVNNDAVLHDFSIHNIDATDIHAEDAGHHDMDHEEAHARSPCNG